MGAPHDEAFDAGRLVCTSLDETMTGFGFQPGQIGTSSREASVVFCAPGPVFRARFPRLAPEIDCTAHGTCADLSVHVAIEGAPRLTRVDLDGYGVDTLAADVGLPDLVPEAMSLRTSPLPQALDHLNGILQEVFGRASIRTGDLHD